MHKNSAMKKIVLLLLLLSAACSSDDDAAANAACENDVIIDNALYTTVETSHYLITGAKIVGDCLEVSIRSGGCSGEDWVAELIDADRVAETATPQRDLKVSLENPELCYGIVTRSFSFNLRPLQSQDKELILNLENWEEPLNYEY